MKLILPICFFLTTVTKSLRIELEETDAAQWNERQIKQIPKPVLGAFADHLHTIASLFSSLIGTGAYKDPQEDALDCEHTSHGFGPYCMMSYDKDSSCYAEFGCEFYDSDLSFGANEDAKLCCFKNYETAEFESTFIHQFNPDGPLRLFQPNQNNVGKVYNLNGLPGMEGHLGQIKVQAGHFGIAELNYIPNEKPSTDSTVIDTWSGCPFNDAVGYHSIEILPLDSDEYTHREMDEDFVRTYFSMCTVEGNGTVPSINQNEDVRSLMPYCTFKLIGQDCPSEAPLAMNFGSQGHILPNDNMFEQLTYIDSTSFCCAKADHDTRQTTVIDVEYLREQISDDSEIYNFFKNRYQVLKWPHADCPEFKFPEFDLMINTVKLSDKHTYPWSFGDMDLTFCTYTKPMTLDEIFSTSSSFDETLSQIILPGDDNSDDSITRSINDGFGDISLENNDNDNTNSRPCDSDNDDDCYVPALNVPSESDDNDEDEFLTNETLPLPAELNVEPTRVIATVNVKDIPSIITVNDHVDEYEYNDDTDLGFN